MASSKAATIARTPTVQKSPDRDPAAEPARMFELITAAEHVFLEKGYHAATMNDVAKAAGMSKKTVYMLIESKAELFDALVTHQQSMLKFPTPEPGWTIRDILIANVTCLARYLLSPSQIAILRLIMAEYTHSPDLGRIFHRNRVNKAKSKLENCFTNLVKTHPHPSAHAKEMAAMLFGMALGEFHIAVLIGYRPAPSKQTLDKRVRQAVDIFLAGCGTWESKQGQGGSAPLDPPLGPRAPDPYS